VDESSLVNNEVSRNTSHAATKTTAARIGFAPPGSRNRGTTAETTSGNAIRWSKRASAASSTGDRGLPALGAPPALFTVR